MSEFSNAVRVFYGLKVSETIKIFRDMGIDPLRAEDNQSYGKYLLAQLRLIREEDRRHIFVAAVNHHLGYRE